MVETNLLDLYAKIGIDDSEYNEGLERAFGRASSFASKIGNGLATAAKVGSAAIGAAATGIAALTKASVDNYAEYEQLVGGVETLFKDSAQTVENYADRAFMSAGLSANEYMTTVTSFSASLLQSLGGDTEKAAEYADRAIIDMADNANKMGTSMEMVQNAYQGFAKQNYTMLDNLKLGYGGTKEEMQRLLDDAEKISGIKFDISSFADITEAIHVMQEEMGIAGTTAAEASGTITGSLAAVKSQWQNLLTAISGDGWDVGIYISNFVDTLKTAASNLMPVITTAISGIGELVAGIAPMIAAEIPQIVNQTLPSLLSAAISLVEGFVAALSDENTRTQLGQAAISIISMLGEALLSMLPDVIALGLDLVISLATGIADHAKEIIPAIVEVILAIVDKLTDPETLADLIVAAVTIIAAIAEGLITGIPELVKKIPEIVKNIVEAFKRAWPQIKQIGTDMVRGIWEGIQSMASWISNKVGGFFDDLFGGVKEHEQIHSPSKRWEPLGKFMAQAIGIGWENEFGHVQDSINKSLDFGRASLAISAGANTSTGGLATGGSFGGTTFSGLTININGANYSDENALAETISLRLQRMTERRGAAYA